MIASVTLRGRTPGEQAPRDLDIYFDSTAEEETDWVMLSIRQPAKNEPFATIRVRISELQRAYAALFQPGSEQPRRDARDAAILERAADRLNDEVADVLAFQEPNP